jgi:hypothetical protein
MGLGFLAPAALVVAMFVYGYQRVDTLEDRTFANARHIEQVSPESSSGATSGGASGASEQESGQQGNQQPHLTVFKSVI